jgi:hypothetical protein
MLIASFFAVLFGVVAKAEVSKLDDGAKIGFAVVSELILVATRA